MASIPIPFVPMVLNMKYIWRIHFHRSSECRHNSENKQSYSSDLKILQTRIYNSPIPFPLVSLSIIRFTLSCMYQLLLEIPLYRCGSQTKPTKQQIPKERHIEVLNSSSNPCSSTCRRRENLAFFMLRETARQQGIPNLNLNLLIQVKFARRRQPS